MAVINSGVFGNLAFLPFEAQTPIVERFEFLTDVIESRDGTEERIELRIEPRQFFEYSVPLQYIKKADAFNTLYGGLRLDWALPIWSEGQFVGNLTASQTVINCDTTLHDLEAPGLALLFNNSQDFEAVEITSKTDTSITISTDISARNGAYLIPIKEAVVMGSPSQATNGFESVLKITFQVKNATIISGTIPTQFSGDDIYFDAGIMRGSSLEKVLDMRQDVADFGIAKPSFSSPWLNPKYRTPYNFNVKDAEEVRALKEWIFRRAGKYRPFWLPTFEDDLRIESTGAITSTLQIANNSTLDFALRRENIAFLDSAGDWHVRTITDFTPSGSSVILTLDTDLNLDASDIMTTSFIGLNRCDTDRFELRWIGNHIVECQVGIVELNA
jgi:hypothetical protein